MHLEGLIADARERRPQPMPPRERTVAGAFAVAFLAALTATSALVPHDRTAHPLVIAGLIVAAAIANRISFEIANGEAFPSQLVFVPTLFLAPLHLVPLVFAFGLLLARMPDFVLRRAHPDRWLHSFASSWCAIPPVLVLGLLAPGEPRFSNAPIYALALFGQVSVGLVEAALGDWLMYGTPPREVFQLAGWGYRIDVVLTPVAYMVASAAVHQPTAILGIMPLFWLLRTFSRERKERYAAALELNQAYRGTVMVLADVVEAEDNYTADHCRSVVELAAAVGDELGLRYEAKQELEIVALLHDVGKIAIPKEILNKPAALTDEEFEVMKTHTIEGQALLSRVGGRLGRVGEIVRSCHERWDGGGYPDGLKGEAIPLGARIVFCCDAYSAMTTDRPYRRAMSSETALEELARNAGTQFEPHVVEALTTVIREGASAEAEPYSDAVRAVLAGHAGSALRLPA
jgi:HD-GYP domain-containing protein (c-di-GMP phosphodiesterase class II)